MIFPTYRVLIAAPQKDRIVSPVADHRARFRLDRLNAGWFLVVLAWLLTQPTAVRAGCDYLHNDSAWGDQPGAPGHFDLLQRYGSPQETILDGPASPLPCSGPSCSRGPRLPDVPPQLGTTLGVDRWGCLALPSLAIRPSAFHRRIPDGRAEPVTGGTSIFHPPRRSAHA